MHIKPVVIIAAPALLLLTIISISDALKYSPLVNSRATAEGTVSGLNCSGHGYYNYSFSVNGRLFESSSNYPFSNKNCSQLLGEKLVVTFLPEDPTISALGNVESLIEEKKSTAIYVSIGFLASLIACVFIFLYDRSK